MTHLKVLNLDGTDIEDGTLRSLGAIHSLEELDLDACRFTDKGLEGTADAREPAAAGIGTYQNHQRRHRNRGVIKNLRAVNLDYTSVDDNAVASLVALAPLQELRLDATGVTDAGMDSLASLSSLKLLNIYHTAVTEKAFDRFKTAVPACHVIWDRDSALPNRRKG